MKKEVLTQVIVNFVLCFMLPAVAMPILYGLRGPEGSTTFITLSLIIVACYSCLVAVFVSLTQDSLSETKRPLFMYLYMGITATLFLVIGELSKIYPCRSSSRNPNGVTPRVADTQNSGEILR